MKKLFLLFQFIILSFSQILYAQTVKPLSIGEKVPDVKFDKMLNHTKSNGKLSDFDGKAIIIDLWFRECGSCIDAMPHLDSIQKEFKDDIKILLVTWQDKPYIEEFWQKNHIGKRFKFTQVVEDTIIRKLFPAVGFPHQIWIDKTGQVAAITDGLSTNKKNIVKLIKGEHIDLKLKSDELDSKINQAIDPMIMYYYGSNKSNIIFYSYFSRYRSEFMGGTSLELDTTNGLTRVSFRNIDFLSLYHYAYSEKFGTPLHRPTRMVRNDRNPIKTEADYDQMTNIFCYDLIYKDSSFSNFGKYMVTDLDRFFNVKSHEEEMMVLCYILMPTGQNERYKEPIEVNEKAYFINSRLKIGEITELNKIQLPLHENFFMPYLDKPFIVELGNIKNLSLKVKWDIKNLRRMNKELAEYGLQIVEENRLRKVIILTDM